VKLQFLPILFLVNVTGCPLYPVIRITHAPIIPEALACLSAISLRSRRRSMNVRVNARAHRHRVTRRCQDSRVRIHRRRWSSHRRGTRFPKRVRDRRLSRDATQSAFPAVSGTDDIRFQHAIQISGSAVHHDDRTTSSTCRRTGLIGIIPVV